MFLISHNRSLFLSLSCVWQLLSELPFLGTDRSIESIPVLLSLFALYCYQVLQKLLPYQLSAPVGYVVKWIVLGKSPPFLKLPTWVPSPRTEKNAGRNPDVCTRF